MISIQPFDLDVIKTHKGFFFLGEVNGEKEIQILHHTPAGHAETDIADAFVMPNGAVIVGWKAQMPVTPMHNLIAVIGSNTKIINLTNLERIIDIYDRPVDAQIGTFIFTNSDMPIARNVDWRCDNGKYGPTPFQPGVRIIDHLSDISVYEPVLSVNGVGHLIYIEGVAKQDIANDFLKTGAMPTVGRTLWETLKLIREWAIVNLPPFNNTDATSLKARLFLKELQLTDAELAVIDSQIPMQIANYLSGSTNARQRPDGVLPITNDVKNILFRRLASGSVSALEYMNPGMWDLEELLNVEFKQLANDAGGFEILKKTMPPNAVSIQTRFFANKQTILDKISSGTF